MCLLAARQPFGFVYARDSFSRFEAHLKQSMHVSVLERSGPARILESGGERHNRMQILNAKVDYLVGAAARLGRIDWRNVFAGVIISFIVTAALPPESARHIFLEFLRAIGHLYGHPELLGR